MRAANKTGCVYDRLSVNILNCILEILKVREVTGLLEAYSVECRVNAPLKIQRFNND